MLDKYVLQVCLALSIGALSLAIGGTAAICYKLSKLGK